MLTFAYSQTLAIEWSIFCFLYSRENEILNKPADNLTDFEINIFHNMEIIRTSGSDMSPILWPRDTLFQYFILLEAIANNMDEKDKIMSLCSMLQITN